MKYMKLGIPVAIIAIIGVLMLPAGIPAARSSENATMVIVLPDNSGQDGQVWVSDGDGGARWETVEGISGNGTATWGEIAGSLSDQADLQTALDGKETPGGAQAKVDAHSVAYSHDQIDLNTEDRHSHGNKNILDAIEESFTTALKTSYDWLVTNITAAWKATVDNFMASKAQPSGIAPLDGNSKVPAVNLGGAGADNTKFLRGDQSWAVPPGGGSVDYKAGSIVTNGNGVGTVTFNTPMADTNYAIALTAQNIADTNIVMYENKAVDGFTVITQDDGGKSEGDIPVDWFVIIYNNP